MRILLDEGVPDVIQKSLMVFRYSRYLRLKKWDGRGIKNGALLDLMAGEFQVIVTTDKNLPFQQDLLKREISAVILPTNRIRVIIPLLPKIESSLAAISPGQAIEITAMD